MWLVWLMACAQSTPSIDVASFIGPSCESAQVVSFGGPEVAKLAVFQGPVPPVAVNVMLVDGQLFVDGERMTIDQLAGRLEEKAMVAKGLAEKNPEVDFSIRELLLQLPSSTPASMVVDLLDTVGKAGFEQVHFVGRSGKLLPEVIYADPAFAKRIHETNADPERAALARHLVTDGVMEACPALMTALAANKFKDHGDERCKNVIALVEDALGQCPNADAAKIVTLFQLGGRNHEQHIVTSRHVQLSDAAPVFTVLRSETWGQIVGRLPDANVRRRWVLSEP